MNLLRKVSITAVRERMLVIRKSDGLDTRTCRQCVPGGVMVSVTTAADISKHSLRTICRWVEAEKIHYLDEPEGLFICLASLPRG